jgi:23S rRNA (cytosine1962-C5)-methyltransferase
MIENKNLITEPWDGYALLDSGDNKKLEQFGSRVLIRPETQAIWKMKSPDLWKNAEAEFRFDGGKGSWRGKNISGSWNIGWGNDAKFSLRLTAFKHVGFFPEQAPNWKWIAERTDHLKKILSRPPKVLNLFGYTGIASIVAAQHGALVTHLDASKQSNTWAKENSLLSNVPADSLRYITDDALKFVEREARRGSLYDGVILDPPAFGRGPDGEVWKIEEDICKLLDAIKKISAVTPGSFFLLNGYAAGYSPQSLLQSAEGSLSPIEHGEFGELRLAENGSNRMVSSGIYVRLVR